MKTFKSLHSYVISIFNNDIALENLYANLRNEIYARNFYLTHIRKISINSLDLEDTVVVSLPVGLSRPENCIALLMSLRAIILKRELIEKCTDDLFLIKAVLPDPYQWVKTVVLFQEFEADADFANLLKMLVAVVVIGNIPKSLQHQFHTTTQLILSNVKENTTLNLTQQDKTIFKSYFIPYNSVITHPELRVFYITKAVKFVHNTALNHCPNLEKIVLSGCDTHFSSTPFYDCPQLKSIVVPKGYGELYQKRLPAYATLICETEAVQQETEKESYQQNSVKDEIVAEEMADKETMLQYFICDLFAEQNTTYLYFWALSLFHLIKTSTTKNCFSVKMVIIRMLAMSFHFIMNNINYGDEDKTPDALQIFIMIADIEHNETLQSTQKKISKHWENKYVRDFVEMLSYKMPEDFKRIWMSNLETPGFSDISGQSNMNDIYRIESGMLLVDDEWFDFFMAHENEIKQHIKHELRNFLYQRNDILSERYIQILE